MIRNKQNLQQITGRLFKIGVFAILLSCFVAMPVFAATPSKSVELYIDGSQISALANTYYTTSGEVQGSYFLDVKPQVKAGRAYVPIRAVSKFLGVETVWESPKISLKDLDKKLAVTLTIGKTTAVKNGKEIKLDAPPYIEKGRTMVPLRFVAEALGCTVNYAGGKVQIDTAPLKINTNKVAALQSESWMTMGSTIYETTADNCINEMYKLIVKNLGQEIATPEKFGRNNDIDSPKFFYCNGEYAFVDGGKKVIAKYGLYTQLNMGMRAEGVIDAFVIQDVVANKWYLFSEKACNAISDAYGMTTWKQISNTVV